MMGNRYLSKRNPLCTQLASTPKLFYLIVSSPLQKMSSHMYFIMGNLLQIANLKKIPLPKSYIIYADLCFTLFFYNT